MKRIRVCKVSELKEGQPRSLKILAREVAVYRIGKDILAREAGCKHMGASLIRNGKWNGRNVTCGWHGWEYDMKTGDCIGKQGVSLRAYDLEITDDEIFLLFEI